MVERPEIKRFPGSMVCSILMCLWSFGPQETGTRKFDLLRFFGSGLSD